MDNNRIEIVASLDIPKTVSTIKDDLKKVADQLNSDQALKIACGIDVKNINVKEMQHNLNTVAQKADLKLNIKSALDKEVVTRDIDEIKKSLQLSVSSVGSKTDFRNAFKPMLQEFRNAYTAMNTEELEKSFDKIIEFIKKTARESIVLDNAFKQVKEDLQAAIAVEGKISIDKPTYGDLKSIYGNDKAVENTLNTVFGSKGWEKSSSKNRLSHQGFDTIIETLNKNQGVNIEYNNLAEGIASLYDVISKPVPKGTILDAVPDLQALFDELAKGLGLPEGAYNVFNWGEIVSGDEEVLAKLANAIEEVKAKTIEATQAAKEFKYPNIEIGKDTQTTLAQAKETLNDFFKAENIDDSANRVKRAIEDTSGELQRFYVQVEREDKSVETLTYALNEQGNAYEYLGKTIREADNSTAFRHEDTSVQWAKQAENLKTFITNAEKAGAASTVLGDDIANLKAKIAQGGDTSAMNSFLDDFDIAKAKLQSFNAEARKENAIANLQNRIKRLTADINAYGEANQRATKSMKQMSNGKTFAVEWSRITTEMAKGADLTDRELKDLLADMAVFRKEAQAAGLAGESAFGKFLNSFKTMSSYVTANMVFNFAKRQIRELVNEVTEVDTAMTELRKVTEATNEEFEAFAISAGKTGRELGASVSDVINATATFARLGESLPDAEELGRVATLYKNVGDGISIETASEDIVSTMKAFKIEASDAITIVDKFNEVGNNFAISSGGIGEALKRSASALAAANNDISESIALITTANTIAQDPTTVGQGIKTVSLRLRSTKTQIEEMGEDAEGAAENVSKLREQMLALTGVDIQFDDSTYKSTYQILLEISKVWDKLDDLSQASVLEQLFGKRQANIGAAILENGKLLEQVYRTSEGSMGSAMREQQEYAKSIQYSIDTLKAAYQDFADSVVNSDFVKNLLGTAQSFLEVLTKIIDKFGALPTILTSIAAIGGLKGVGKLIPNMPKLALLQSKAQVDTPYQRDFQLLEMPKAV